MGNARFSFRRAPRAAALSQMLLATVALTHQRFSHAQQPFFMGLGDLPGGTFNSVAHDVSGNGTVVVGQSRGANDAFSTFRWTRAEGMVAIGSGTGGLTDVSGDGSTIVAGTAAFRWTQSAGLENLPLLSTNGVSGDGSVVVGENFQPTPGVNQAARWTKAGGVENLFAGLGSTAAWDVSSDDSVVLGSESNLGYFIWTAASGYTYLGASTLTGALSANGKVVVGSFTDGGTNRAYRWTAESSLAPLGLLPDGLTPSQARGVSANGSIVVGVKGGVDAKAIIWDSAHGSRYVRDVLTTELGLGAAVAGWDLRAAWGTSDDGRTIVGEGTNPNGDREAWIAYLGAPVPEPAGSALGAAALFALAGFSRARRVKRYPAR